VCKRKVTPDQTVRGPTRRSKTEITTQAVTRGEQPNLRQAQRPHRRAQLRPVQRSDNRQDAGPICTRPTGAGNRSGGHGTTVSGTRKSGLPTGQSRCRGRKRSSDVGVGENVAMGRQARPRERSRQSHRPRRCPFGRAAIFRSRIGSRPTLSQGERMGGFGERWAGLPTQTARAPGASCSAIKTRGVTHHAVQQNTGGAPHATGSAEAGQPAK